mmetsp:Transcript_1856/g.3796  ORF Transcript_1856/g.3796 Transcript_1856/m.3796 type:complete len:388 (-) Transcript_1856:774-1937(-)
MPDRLGAHEREQDVVVLLPLVLVHRRDLVRHPQRRVRRTPLRRHVVEQCHLAVVGGEEGDLVGGVADEAHVHVHGDDVLGLGKVLEEVCRRLALAHPAQVLHLDHLELVGEAAVRRLERRARRNVRHVAERLVAPVVERRDRGPRTPLLVELDVGDAEAHEACEEALVHARVLLERHVLDDRRQLVVVADEHDALEAARLPLDLLLQEHRDEGLDLEDLRRLLHHERVELEPGAHKVVPLQRRVRACHGNDLGLRRHQVLGTLLVGAQDFERAALVQEGEDILQVAEAPLGGPPVRVMAPSLLEHRLGSVGEEFRKREEIDNVLRTPLLHLVLILLPARKHVEQVEMLRGLAGVVNIRHHSQALGEPPDLAQQLDALAEHELYAPVL